MTRVAALVVVLVWCSTTDLSGSLIIWFPERSDGSCHTEDVLTTKTVVCARWEMPEGDPLRCVSTVPER